MEPNKRFMKYVPILLSPSMTPATIEKNAYSDEMIGAVLLGSGVLFYLYRLTGLIHDVIEKSRSK